MDNKKENGFSYTYSAKEQQEIRDLREKYTKKSQQEDKIARLRRLDTAVTQKAQALSLAFGVVGVLILGFGMSLFMSDLGEALGWQRQLFMPVGISVGVVGGVLAAFAYPVYNAVLKRERSRVAPEIIRLTDELLK